MFLEGANFPTYARQEYIPASSMQIKFRFPLCDVPLELVQLSPPQIKHLGVIIFFINELYDCKWATRNSRSMNCQAWDWFV